MESKKISFKRILTGKEYVELMKNRDNFIKKEIERTRTKLIEQKIISPDQKLHYFCKSSIDSDKLFIYIFHGKLETRREPIFDPIVYENGEYKLLVYMPGVREQDINVSFLVGNMIIRAGEYMGVTHIPNDIKECVKRYKNGMLDLRLR
jgi:hypothetical protein